MSSNSTIIQELNTILCFFTKKDNNDEFCNSINSIDKLE